MDLEEKKQRLYTNWKDDKVITDEKLLCAFLKVPREEFIGENVIDDAYSSMRKSLILGFNVSRLIGLII